MSAIPELKQKKNERDALLAKEEAAAAAASEIKSAEMIHTITERAKKYEEEYREVYHHHLIYIFTNIRVFTAM
jgi:hypothetical protein